MIKTFNNSPKKRVNISIGECYASKEPAIIYTLLGSCVAVCLFEPNQRMGGMNHILMPGKADLEKHTLSTRFGVNAMEVLINALMKLGADRKQIVAKVFGGASVIPGINEKLAVGQKIARFVLDFLAQEKIKIISQDLGGIHTRKIFFHTDTGDVFLKRVRSMKSSALAAEEQKKMEQLKKKIKKNMDITFF